jgi:hypothetical protein
MCPRRAIIGRTRGIRAPRQTQCPPSARSGQLGQRQVGALGDPHGHRELGDRRDPEPAGDHLLQRVGAGRGKSILIAPITGKQAAHCKCLVMQAVPVLLQQQPFGRQGGDRDLFLACQPMIGGQSDHERVARHRHRVGPTPMSSAYGRAEMKYVALHA